MTTKELIEEVAEQDKALSGAEALVQAEKPIDEVQKASYGSRKILLLIVVILSILIVLSWDSSSGKNVKTTGSRYTYNGTRRVRQLALGCESN